MIERELARRPADAIQFPTTTIPPTAPKVSVVISSLDGGGELVRCIESLRMQDCPDFEILLVDNGSVDGSPEIIAEQFPAVRLIKSADNLGFAGGGNLGASMAGGEFLLFLNHDMEFSTSFLVELIRVMDEDPSIGIAQARVLKLDDRETIDTIGSFWTKTGFVIHRASLKEEAERPEGVQEIFAGAGGAILVRKEPFMRLGGFDADYLIYAEDVDLSWRFWLAGLRVVIVNSSIIYHAGGRTTKRLPPEFVIFHTFKNRLCTLLKNSTVGSLAQTGPLHLALCAGGVILFLSRGKLRTALAIMRAVFWNMTNARRTLAKRRRVSQLSGGRLSNPPRHLQRRMPFSYLIRAGDDYVRSW